MKSSTKAQGLSLTTIIIAILVLIVLVVLIMVFTGRIGEFRTGVTKTEESICSLKEGHRCLPAEQCPSFDRVGDVGKFSDCSAIQGSEEYCCKVA